MINFELLSKILSKKAESLRLDKSQYDEIRSRRSFLENIIKEFIKNSNFYEFHEFKNIGSYATNTGVEYDDNDFDIDYALILKTKYVLDNTRFTSFRDGLISKIRGEVKERYKRDVNILNKKSAITIRYLEKNDEIMFHIDIPIFFLKDEFNPSELIYAQRNEEGIFNFIDSEIMITLERQKVALKNNNDKRILIRLLKYLFDIYYNVIDEIPSAYIIDKVISLPNVDIYSLFKLFFEKFKNDNIYLLPEKPYSNMLKKVDTFKMNSFFQDISSKLNSFGDNYSVYLYLKKFFKNDFPNLELEKEDSNFRSHRGG